MLFGQIWRREGDPQDVADEMIKKQKNDLDRLKLKSSTIVFLKRKIVTFVLLTNCKYF